MKHMEEAITFADVLIKPQFSMVKSRKDVDLSVNRMGIPYMDLPVISANMDTVTTDTMARAMISNGAQACLHRFQSIEENVDMFVKSRIDESGRVQVPLVSVGLGKLELERAEALKSAGASTFIIDVAHGAQIAVVRQVKQLRELLGNNVGIVAGNFATADSVKDFLLALGSETFVDGLKLGVGNGCFAVGTKILMSNGTYKNIEDIKIHDKVINKDGKSVQVIGVKFSGFKQTISYKNNIFYEHTRVTPDHKHWVGDYSTTKEINDVSIREILSQPTKKDESKIKWLPIEMCKKAALLMPKTIAFELPETFEIDINDFAQSRRTLTGLHILPKLKPSYELGYIFGTFLGDGNSRLDHTERTDEDGKIRRNTCGSTQWYFGKDELYIAEKLVKCIKNSFSMNASIKEKTNMFTVINQNNSISRLLLEFNKRDKKALPEKYICSNKEYLKGLYDGLIDSDGNYDKDGRVSFANTSKKLIEQFSVIFYLVNGYFPSINIRKPFAGGLKNCKLENCKPSYVCKSVTRPEFNILDSNQLSKIYAWNEDTITVPTYDIEVDCDTHSFIANNAIVHNSRCLTRVVTGCGFPQFSTILEVSALLKNSDYITLIADGGMDSGDDVAKAIAAGAHFVMSGSFFAGTDESPGEMLYVDSLGRYVKPEDFLPKQVHADGTFDYIIDEYSESFPKVKKYRGSASRESYEVQGKLASHRVPEGESTYVKYKGPVKDVLQSIDGGLRSTLSYSGCFNIREFHQKVQFARVSTHTTVENGTRNGLK